MIPGLIQTQLQQFYDLELSCQVNDYLITDRQLVSSLGTRPFTGNVEEKLLIREEPDGLGVSLFLAEELLSSLAGNNPFDHLNNDNLGEFCTALEGVSHFIYLTWNATYDRPVSQLELELQAEVDKFVSIILLASEQGNAIQWQDINDILFANCEYDPSLDSTELARYQCANDYASYFCSQLERRNTGPIDSEITRKELRRFYRKRHLEKLSECNQASAISGP